MCVVAGVGVRPGRAVIHRRMVWQRSGAVAPAGRMVEWSARRASVGEAPAHGGGAGFRRRLRRGFVAVLVLRQLLARPARRARHIDAAAQKVQFSRSFSVGARQARRASARLAPTQLLLVMLGVARSALGAALRLYRLLGHVLAAIRRLVGLHHACSRPFLPYGRPHAPCCGCPACCAGRGCAGGSGRPRRQAPAAINIVIMSIS